MAGFTTGEQTTNQQAFYTPQGLEALYRDLQALIQHLGAGNGILGQESDVLSGQTPIGQSVLGQPVSSASAAASHAAETAGSQGGLGTRSVSNIHDLLRALLPQLYQPLQATARQGAQGIDSLVDPRLASFLRPDTVQSNTVTPSGLQTATSILNTAGQVAGAVGNVA